MASVPLSVAYVKHLQINASPTEKKTAGNFAELTENEGNQVVTQQRWPSYNNFCNSQTMPQSSFERLTRFVSK